MPTPTAVKVVVALTIRLSSLFLHTRKTQKGSNLFAPGKAWERRKRR